MEQQILSNQEIIERLNQMQTEINVIKESLDEDGELTDWAKEELERARKSKDKIPQEEVRKMILGK